MDARADESMYFYEKVSTQTVQSIKIEGVCFCPDYAHMFYLTFINAGEISKIPVYNSFKLPKVKIN